jgi:aryl-alcohol dehydrogenase-like predicted oxidoreductase
MEHVAIRDLPIPASRIGLGTWPMGGVQWGGTDDNESIRTIHAALDRGVNVIDTAPAYGFGHSEEVVGRAVESWGHRDRVVIATKCGLERHGDALYRNSSRRQILEEVEDSLRRLRTDYIDLYQVHWPDPRTPYEETAQVMLELQRAGKIRALGTSNYSIEAMARFQRIAPKATAQPPLNMFERDAQDDIIPWCEAHGVGTLVYGALCRGLLTGTIDERTTFVGDDLRKTDPKFLPPRFARYLEAVRQIERYARDSHGKHVLGFALRWVLDQPGVSIALCGARHAGELDVLDDIVGWNLDADDLDFVDEVLDDTVPEPIGPEFMAPPEQAYEERASAPM